MESDERRKIVGELGAAFGGAQDVSPDSSQPLHVLLPSLRLISPWTSPARGLVSFAGWPTTRPDFWIDMAVVNAEGQPPYSDNPQYVLGETWRHFSFNFPWTGSETPTRAVQLWLTRFREAR